LTLMLVMTVGSTFNRSHYATRRLLRIKLAQCHERPLMDTYKIVRMFFRSGVRNRTIETRLSLEEAQAHCKQPNTSSSTATSDIAYARTQKYGPWFDGYEKE
jgi:hypothetical protein